LYIINFMIIVISSIQYDQRCTFSLDTCNWSIGRRWQAKNLDDEVDDKGTKDFKLKRLIYS
jgi:hypothetical protein